MRHSHLGVGHSQQVAGHSLLGMRHSETQPSGSGSKSKKQKWGRSEATNELLEKMITMQKSSDQMMSLEEKRIKMEERQMEIDVQMRCEEWQFQLQMMQILIKQNMTHHPMPPHYRMHSTFNFDPDETQDEL